MAVMFPVVRKLYFLLPVAIDETIGSKASGITHVSQITPFLPLTQSITLVYVFAERAPSAITRISLHASSDDIAE